MPYLSHLCYKLYKKLLHDYNKCSVLSSASRILQKSAITYNVRQKVLWVAIHILFCFFRYIRYISISSSRLSSSLPAMQDGKVPLEYKMENAFYWYFTITCELLLVAVLNQRENLQCTIGSLNQNSTRASGEEHQLWTIPSSQCNGTIRTC